MADSNLLGLAQLVGAPDPADQVYVYDASAAGDKRQTIEDLFTWLARSDPAAAAAGSVKVYSKNVAGRIVPKFIGPAGVDTAFQASLWGNNIVFYAPSSAALAATGFGTTWAESGTATHPTPATTAPAIVNQMRRKRYANVVTTTNQVLGAISTAAGMPQFWRGNAAGLGGFFFHCRFVVELWPAATCRFFVGLTSLATGMVASDAPTGDFCGFWHDTTQANTVTSFTTRDNVTTTKAAIAGAPTIAAKQAYDAYIYSPPNGSAIFYRLVDINTGAEIVNTSTTTTIPRNTIFMGPQVVMSNGTANITVDTVAIAINRIYIESDN